MVEVIQNLGLASILLLCGYALRTKVGLLQKLYIPASVVGGMLGLLLGPEVLGALSPLCIRFSETASSYAMPLLAIVFSSQFLGASLNRETLRHTGATFFLNCSTIALQVTLGLLLTYLLLPHNEKLYLGFGLFPFLGFYGGHGVCTSTAEVFDAAGTFPLDLGLSVGNTFATIGLLYGLVIGIIVINICARKGLISSHAGTKARGGLQQTGLLPPEERHQVVTAMTKSDVLNPVALHAAILGMVMYLSYSLLPYIQKIPTLDNLNVTVPVLFVSVAVNLLSKRFGLNQYIDHKSLSSLSGVALEYLIVLSVANTKLSIFADFGLEILCLSAVILAVNTAFVLFFGHLFHRDHWVENTLGTLGLSCGVLATGFLLIRIADPDAHTGAAANLSCGNAVSTPTVQMFFNYIFASVLVASPLLACGIPAVLLILFPLTCFLLLHRRTP